MNDLETFSEHVVTDDALEHTLETIEQIRMVGNTIPYAWFDHVRTPDGKVNLIAIHLLSEIVYWYTPDRVFDPDTGEYIGYQKRFKGNLFCRFANAFEEQFGLTSEQVRSGLSLLQALGLITVEQGQRRTNDYPSFLMYRIGIDATAIARISQLTFGDFNE